MVRDMQAAVSSGTMEMDRCRNGVSLRIGEVAERERAARPDHRAGAVGVTGSLEDVHEGMQGQVASVRHQIRDAMEGLRAGAGRIGGIDGGLFHVRSTTCGGRSANSTPKPPASARAHEAGRRSADCCVVAGGLAEAARNRGRPWTMRAGGWLPDWLKSGVWPSSVTMISTDSAGRVGAARADCRSARLRRQSCRPRPAPSRRRDRRGRNAPEFPGR